MTSFPRSFSCVSRREQSVDFALLGLSTLGEGVTSYLFLNSGFTPPLPDPVFMDRPVIFEEMARKGALSASSSQHANFVVEWITLPKTVLFGGVRGTDWPERDLL